MKQNSQSIKIQQSVADFYETYGEAFSDTRVRSWDVIQHVQDVVRPGMTVIDAGAGNARLVDVMPDRVTYVAIEPSAALRAEAEKRIKGNAMATVREGGFPSLPAKDAEADVSVCLAVIQHIPTAALQQEAIKELARITKPGGAAVVTVWNLRGKRMWSWKTWAAAWLRLPMVRGGSRGDAWIPWKANGAATKRFVHAFTQKEFASLFDPRDWEIERNASWGKSGPVSVLDARYLVVIAKRK